MKPSYCKNWHILSLCLSALKLDAKDPAIALNYAIFLYNRSCQEKEDSDDKIYNDAIDKIQLFETRVRKLRESSSGMDADPDVLMAAASLAKEMEYSLSISTPSVPDTSGTSRNS